MSSQPSLLIKIPTRSRPHKFFKTLDTYYQRLSFTLPYTFLISCDSDDQSMNNPTIIKRLQNYPHLEFSFSDNHSKIEAYNRDLDKFDFDILIAASDDMIPMVDNFDIIIAKTMKESFPDFDGVINSNDGAVGAECNTIPIIGKTFYKRFGYIYNPAYKALVCNVELTTVSKILKKEKIIDNVLIKHHHPAWGLASNDDLYMKNEGYHAHDKAVFMERRARLFDLPSHEVEKATPKTWSILICTIEEREQSFFKLCSKLKTQIDALGLENQIEIISCKDKRGEHSIGYKRNLLVQESKGKYISFIDDDDDIHDKYIQMIYEKLLKNPDCVNLNGIITFNGSNPKRFYHSLKYTNYTQNDSEYFRPPNHLNPMRRSIAVQFMFAEKNYGEDTDWAMMIARSKLLRTEEVIEEPYYFYLYNE
jgi:glycosyltransferase involved in cell wall biosynthesis